MLNLVIPEIRRIINRLFGEGPYDLIEFERIISRVHSEEKYGIDYPESFTDILYEDAVNWVNYHDRIYSLTRMSPKMRMVNNNPRFLISGIAPEPQRIIYSLSQGGIVGNTGIVYDIKSRLSIKKTTHNWTSPPDFILFY